MTLSLKTKDNKIMDLKMIKRQYGERQTLLLMINLYCNGDSEMYSLFKCVSCR